MPTGYACHIFIIQVCISLNLKDSQKCRREYMLIFIYGEKFRQNARGALRERQLNGHMKSRMTLVVFYYATTMQRDAFCNRGIASFLKTFGSSHKQVN